MGQRKCVVFGIPVLISLVMMFSVTVAVAVDWTSCMVNDSVGGNAYQISIDNSTGNFPLVFTDNNTTEARTYCGDASLGNYPCSVFKYKIAKKSNSAPEYNHLNFTIPFCPNGEIIVSNSSPALETSCNSFTSSGNDTLIKNCGIQMGRFNALNSNGVNPVGSPPQDLFHIVVRGDVGLGVNSLSVYQSTSTQTNYPCSNGILGPGCQTAAKQTPLVRLSTLCTTLEGQTYLARFVDGIGTKIAACSDTTCNVCGTEEDLKPLSDLVIDLEYTDANGNIITVPGEPIKGFAGLLGDISNLSGYMSFHDSPGCTLVNFGGRYLYKCTP